MSASAAFLCLNPVQANKVRLKIPSSLIMTLDATLVWLIFINRFAILFIQHATRIVSGMTVATCADLVSIIGGTC